MQLTKEEQLQRAKDELREIFSDYSMDVEIKDVESAWGEEGTAFQADIKFRYTKIEPYEMTVEMIGESGNLSNLLPSVEFGEDNWDEIDREIVWKWLFFSADRRLERAKNN